MTDLPSMPLYVDDYESHTPHLSLEEDGCYNRLLRLCWRSPDCMVPANPAWLMRKLRVDEATFQRACVPVIEEFFTKKGGMIFQKNQQRIFSKVTGLVEARAAAGSRGGKAKSAKTKENEDSKATDLPEANDKQNDTFALASKTKTKTKDKEEEDAQAREAEFEFSEEEKPDPITPGFITDLLQAVGHSTSAPPPFWTGPGLVAHVRAWMDQHGLTPDQIIAGARDSRTRNPEPPDGPKALDRWMERLGTSLRSADGVKPGKALQKAESKPPATPEERLKFYADWINDPNKYCPPSAVSTQTVQALLHSGLVTIERLKSRGIAA